MPAVPGTREHDRVLDLKFCGYPHHEGLSAAGSGHGSHAVHGRLNGQLMDPLPRLPEELDTFRQVSLPFQAGKNIPFLKQGTDLPDRGETPDFLQALGHGMIGQVPRWGGVQMGCHRLDGACHIRGCGGAQIHSFLRFLRSGGNRRQPTAPSIWSAMSRFSSRAYSIGNSFAMGSTKPRTIMAIASSSSMPRDMR